MGLACIWTPSVVRRRCEADEDGDGLCDDEDDCVGEYDDCGICNGPARSTSAAVQTSQRAIAIVTATRLMLWASAAAREADEDGDGICDDVDDRWASTTTAASATVQARFTSADVQTSQRVTATARAIRRRVRRDGRHPRRLRLCWKLACCPRLRWQLHLGCRRRWYLRRRGRLQSAVEVLTEYKLTVESFNGALGTTYRLYVNASDPSDKISWVGGNDQAPLVINTPDGIYNDVLNPSWNASGVNEALFGFFPDLEFDSYATVGLKGSLQV